MTIKMQKGKERENEDEQKKRKIAWSTKEKEVGELGGGDKNKKIKVVLFKRKKEIR